MSMKGVGKGVCGALMCDSGGCWMGMAWEEGSTWYKDLELMFEGRDGGRKDILVNIFVFCFSRSCKENKFVHPS